MLCSFKFVAGIVAAIEPIVATAASLYVNEADALRVATRKLFIFFYSERTDITDFKTCGDLIAYIGNR